VQRDVCVLPYTAICDEPKRGLIAGKAAEESVVHGVIAAYSSTLMTGASGTFETLVRV